jgi:hypothetical protein
MEAYLQAWKLGLKAVAVYRDGCKKSQPLSAAGTTTALSKKEDAGARAAQAIADEQDMHAPPRAIRHRLDDERMSITHKFNVGGHEGYITVGLYEDGSPGEVFITMAKEGSTIGGLMDTIATLVSVALAAMVADALATPSPALYAWLSDRLYRYGLARTSLQVVLDFLGGPLTPDPFLKAISGGRVGR